MEPGKHLQKTIGALLIVAMLHTIFALSELLAARSAVAQGAAIDKRALLGACLLPVVFVLLAVAGLAALIPSLRASRINPVDALRTE